MTKQTLLIVILIVITSGLRAQNDFKSFVNSKINRTVVDGDEFVQRDLTDYIVSVTDNTDKEMYRDTEQKLWITYANAVHPSVTTLHKYFEDAGKEFGVPSDLLKAIGQVENNWMQIGPSMDKGWGIMHLVDNNYCSTLKEAAALLKLDVQTLKDDAKQNIRGAAALIAKYAGEKSYQFTQLEDWFDAAKLFSGLINDDLREMQAENYYNVLKEGKSEMTVWEEYVVLENHPTINIEDKLINKAEGEKSISAVDYPGAIDKKAGCNYSSRNGTDIDTWVNHYIGTGTVAGAISWFQNPNNTNSSAHFILAVNGTLYQCVAIANKAWHCGTSVSSGALNNHRSIGIEHDVTPSTPSNWNNTTMLNKSTEIARYFCNLHAIPKTRTLPGIRGHKEMPGTNTSCPGNLPWDTWMNLLNGSTTPPTVTAPAAGATGVAIPVPFAWTSSVTGAEFRLQVSTSNTGWTATNGFSSGTTTSATLPVNVSTGTTKSFSWSQGATGTYTGPQFGTTYYYTVRQYSASTGTSNYSPVRSFTVKNQTITVLDNFDVNVGHFNSSPTASGSTVGIDAATSTLTRTTLAPQSGAGCLRAELRDNAANTSNWVVRLLSGGGSPANNTSFNKSGKISFWLKTSSANTGATVGIWVDDSDGTEQSLMKPITNDGVWHLYEFDLTNFQGTAITGNGLITGTTLTLDAVVLKRPHATNIWYCWIDELKYSGFTKSFTADIDSELSSQAELAIYPNPVSDILNINFPENSQNNLIQVYDISGKLVIEQKESSSNALVNFDGLQKGLYIIKIKTDSESIIRKVMKN